jgi:hypothetical protein
MLFELRIVDRIVDVSQPQTTPRLEPQFPCIHGYSLRIAEGDRHHLELWLEQLDRRRISEQGNRRAAVFTVGSLICPK